VEQGHWQAIADAQKAISNYSRRGVVIANGADPTGPMNLEPGAADWTARMFENFVPAAGTSIPPSDSLTVLMAETRIAQVRRKGRSLSAHSSCNTQ
jgi:hypothetical protein